MKLNEKELSDEQLCLKVANGERDSEEILVLRYSRLVRVCARPYFLVGGDSEDLIQEGMLGLLVAIREYSPDKQVAFRTYANLCIRRRIISAIRMAMRDKHTPLNSYVSLELSLDVEDGENYPSLIAALGWQESPEHAIIDKEQFNALKKQFDKQLSSLEQSILDLYLKGFSYSEIAKEVGRTAKSVDNAVQRIRRKIAQQNQLGEYSES